MKEKIKQILRENTEDQITKLSVFDFDGTTVDTGMPDTHKIIYKEKTGEDWPHKGWWGRPESLDTNIFDFKAIPEVKSAYTTIKYMRQALKERGVSDLEMDYIFQGIYYRMSENKKN